MTEGNNMVENLTRDLIQSRMKLVDEWLSSMGVTINTAKKYRMEVIESPLDIAKPKDMMIKLYKGDELIGERTFTIKDYIEGYENDNNKI